MPLGASPLLASARPNNIGFLPCGVPKSALLIGPSLYSPGGVPFGPALIVPGVAYRLLRLSAFGVPPYPRRRHDLLCPRLLRHGQEESLPPQSRFCDLPQISRGKFDRLRRATPGFTTSELDGYGLRHAFARSPATVGLLSGSGSSARIFAPRFFPAPPRDECDFTVALRYHFTSITL
jgi:hypothetical protein